MSGFTKFFIRVKRTRKPAQIPCYATKGSIGADLYSTESVIIEPHQTYLMPTGLIFEPSQMCDMQIRSRSGLACKHNIVVLNSPGTIDPDYRSEVCVLLHNLDDKPYAVYSGDRIAQLVCNPLRPEFLDVKDVDMGTERIGGFGSTGV